MTERTPDQIRDEIEHTRHELGETAEALAYKADVKARAKERVEEKKEAAREKVEGVRDTVISATPESVRRVPLPVILGVAAATGFAIAWLLAHRGD